MLLVIGLGLASRRYPGMFPAFLGKSPGDALWALAVFVGLGILFPRASTGRTGAAALAIAFLVELGQLYQAPWINAIRATLPGRLLLGTTFVWSDLPAYAVGVALGVLAEYGLRRILRGRKDAVSTACRD